MNTQETYHKQTKITVTYETKVQLKITNLQLYMYTLRNDPAVINTRAHQHSSIR